MLNNVVNRSFKRHCGQHLADIVKKLNGGLKTRTRDFYSHFELDLHVLVYVPRMLNEVSKLFQHDLTFLGRKGLKQNFNYSQI